MSHEAIDFAFDMVARRGEFSPENVAKRERFQRELERAQAEQQRLRELNTPNTPHELRRDYCDDWVCVRCGKRWSHKALVASNPPQRIPNDCVTGLELDYENPSIHAREGR